MTTNTTTRKSMLYKTDVEYGDYTMNHVLGCSHGCLYPCYAFLLARRFGKVATYEEWCKPKLVSNTLEILEQEIPRLKSKINSVHLSFTTDPFMYGYDEIKEVTIAAIKKLNMANIPCTVLTKGLLPIELSELSTKNEYGITLISLDENYRKRIEPGAASYINRIAALKVLHDKGCRTWVSIEPYPTPNLIKQDVLTILNAVSFTNRIIFGRTNYSKEVSAFTKHREFYNEQARVVIQFCKEHNIDFHIKDGTLTEVKIVA
ncbi:MAG: radical SAM protein [Spirochaetaceae bacterium]|nr:radical SAM protein [Spirochaetaceae bacterium]